LGRLTTHVLDTARGCPGKGIRVELYRLDTPSEAPVATATTNDDGRCDQPLLSDAAFAAGRYELVFHAGAYFDALGLEGGRPRFLDEIAIRFGVDRPEQHYHVPLLLSPYGYSTYRGS
jgi:5-hydroxyisourate hydrolase